MTDLKKGVIGCKITWNSAILKHFFEIFDAICKFDDLKEHCNQKSKNRGGITLRNTLHTIHF